ncbi:S-layer homology domain-containing protein [Microbacteriaceae bacterium VKM Ac-2855]|nr:S-layer homology domain-containing protein [Microbacteriaceae bacterium VKM Ac-2855]
MPAANPFSGEIAWLAESGITEGYSDGMFHPLAIRLSETGAAPSARGTDATRLVPSNLTKPGSGFAAPSTVPGSTKTRTHHFLVLAARRR